MVSARHFDAWWKRQRHQTPDLLTLTLDDLLSAEAAEALDAGRLPRGVDLGDARPGRGRPASPVAVLRLRAGQRKPTASPSTSRSSTLNQARPEEFSWQVPGLRHELVTELIRSLPKALRRELVPAPDVAREVLARLDGTDPGRRHQGRAVPRAAAAARRAGPARRLRPGQAPAAPADHIPHTRQRPASLATGKDLAALQRQLRPKLRATLSARATALTRTGLTTWDFGTLPQVFTDGEVKAYPALVDNGDAVDVRLFETPETARAAMLAGTGG